MQDDNDTDGGRLDPRRIALTGRVVHDPQFAVRGEIAHATFMVAVSQLSRKYDGTVKKTFRFATVTATGEQAEACRQKLTRGATCLVAGILVGERHKFGSDIESWLTVAADRVEIVKVETPYLHRNNGTPAQGA